MRLRGSSIWVALVVLVVIIGCGGSNYTSAGSTPVTSFQGTWFGEMFGADGSDYHTTLTVSSGTVSGTAKLWDVKDPVYTISGSIQNSGTMYLTGKAYGFPTMVIAGNLVSEGGSTSTGCCFDDAGSGTMRLGITQVPITFQLESFL